MNNFFSDNRKAIYGGIVATVLTGLGIFLLGQLSGYEAKELIESSHSGLNMLCNTITLASATILTLLLTLLGISTGTESKLKSAHYYQVLDIAKLDTILIVSAIVMFQLFNIQITEADNVPLNWYSSIYWISLFCTSVLSGMMITVVLMLYTTITAIIHIVGLKNDHRLITREDEEEKKEEMSNEKEKMSNEK
ncbi:hypothetical protein [uncultured Christiangramia sp.]|uniref:hypothetical protein n=1 Tax=uncultured Christiangramia sp. TaxID=503836 RepID=UPI0025F05620|nr:hypothetical protein [uncultured Christiangramia sp.]|tara:strand:+ start:6625 stop:7203 length:579 start_codon:yes stop_codon:yes gene_type:complete